jgi:Caspase domain
VPKLGSGEEGLLRSESLSLQQMLDDLKHRSPGLSLVIIDACRENPFALPGGRSTGGKRGLALIAPPKGTFVLYSAGADESALDRLPGRDPTVTSVFTRMLLPLLKKPGLTLQEIAVQTREAVSKLAASVPHEQNPAYYDGISGPPMCLAGCRDLALEQSEAAREWTNVDRNNLAGLQSFIQRHPGTAEAAIAKARLSDLRAAAIPVPQPAPKRPKATQPADVSEPDKPGSVKPVVRCGFNEKLITGKCVAKPKKCDPDENLVNGKCVPKVISQPNVQGPIGSSPRTSVTNGYSNVNREACVKRCDGWSPTNRWKCVAFECK